MDKFPGKQTPPLPGLWEVGYSNDFQVMGRVCTHLSFQRLKLYLSGHNSDHFDQPPEP